MTMQLTQPLPQACMYTRHGSKPVAIVHLCGLCGLYKGGVV